MVGYWKETVGALGIAMIVSAAGQPALAQDSLTTNLAEVAAEMDAQFPIKVSDDIDLVDATADGHKFTLHYEVERNAQDEGGVEAMKQAFQADQDANLCTNEEFKKMLHMGVDLWTTFKTKDGQTFTTPITKAALSKCG